MVITAIVSVWVAFGVMVKNFVFSSVARNLRVGDGDFRFVVSHELVHGVVGGGLFVDVGIHELE